MDTAVVLDLRRARRRRRLQKIDISELLEVTAGPRLNFPEPLPGIKAGSLKPYVILNEVGLGGNQYFYTYGAGVTPPAGVNVLDPRVVYAPPPPRWPGLYDDDGIRIH